MKQIQMVDLTTQYARIQREIDNAILEVARSGQYINGEAVTLFSENLKKFTGANYVIPCANGTDALQISLMSAGLKAGDEVIVPAFTYAAAVEAVALLGLIPVLVDVDPLTYNIDSKKIRDALSPRTKAIIPVHLFGQSCDMTPILTLCKEEGLFLIEDNAQSIGAVYNFSDKEKKQTGTMGDIGIVSFFPTKNLGCYGDGGAMLTNDENLAGKLKMIASHGQSGKYRHEIIGCNSRLDTLQAAVLNVKLRHLKKHMQARQKAAIHYEKGLLPLTDIIETPFEMPYSTHVFNQYTIQVKNGKRDELQAYLKEHGVPSVVYYPIPIQDQPAFRSIARISGDLDKSIMLSKSVLSLPMHTELEREQLDYIINTITQFFT